VARFDGPVGLTEVVDDETDDVVLLLTGLLEDVIEDVELVVRVLLVLVDVVEVDGMVLEVTVDDDVTTLDELEDELVDVVDEVEDEDDDAVPCCAVPCIESSVYPPSLQNVRYETEIPSEFGRNTSCTVNEAPAAKVEPTAGKFGEVYPFPTTDDVTLLYGIPLA
jgi:hypothetical protein